MALNDRQYRARTCTTKQRYASRRAARVHVFGGMHVYRCPFGRDHFHVGH